MLPPVGLQAVVISDSTVILRFTDSSLAQGQLPTDNRVYTVRYSRVNGGIAATKNVGVQRPRNAHRWTATQHAVHV